MPAPLHPKISWDEIEALNTEHTVATAPSKSDEPWATKERRAKAQWNFQRAMVTAWPKIYAELKDAYRGEAP